MLQGMPTTFPEDGVFGFATVLWKDGVTVNDMIAHCYPQRLERWGRSLKQRDADLNRRSEPIRPVVRRYDSDQLEGRDINIIRRV